MRNIVLLLVYSILGWCALFPGHAIGQKAHYSLEGTVTIDGGNTYLYQLDFTEHKGAISGYSLTWLSENYPGKAMVTGTMDKKNHTITFSEKEEKNILFLKFPDMCYFNGTLPYILSDTMFELSGRYFGLNEYSQYCGQGKITLSGKTEKKPLCKLRFKPKQQQQPIIPVKQEIIEEPPHKNVEVITSTHNSEIATNSDSCVIDIWDYGTVDGDIISVLFNGKKLLDKYEITADKKQLRLGLLVGTNSIQIVAENEGSAFPNTARLQLSYGSKQRNFTAYNTVGNRATLLLVRK